MAPRTQASRTGFPSSEGQGAQSGAVGTTSQSCLPRGPGPPGQGMGGTERGGQNNLEGGKTDVTFLVSHLPGNSGQSQDVSDHRLSLHTGKLRSERHHPSR